MAGKQSRGSSGKVTFIPRKYWTITGITINIIIWLQCNKAIMMFENHATSSGKSGEYFFSYEGKHNFKIMFNFTYGSCSWEAMVFLISQSALKNFGGVCSSTTYFLRDCVFCCACGCMSFEEVKTLIKTLVKALKPTEGKLTALSPSQQPFCWHIVLCSYAIDDTRKLLQLKADSVRRKKYLNFQQICYVIHLMWVEMQHKGEDKVFFWWQLKKMFILD